MGLNRWSSIVALALGVAGIGAVWAQASSQSNAKKPAAPAAASAPAAAASVPAADHGAPAPGAAAMSPLKELPGVVSWSTLAKVQTTTVKDKAVPQFVAEITALDKKEVKLQGFMMPLEMGEKQSHFILTSNPPSCGFCMPGGADAVVEVRTKRPVQFSLDPIVIAGRFTVLRNDPTGLYYRMTDAAAVPKK